jgi:hypothetical protein
LWSLRNWVDHTMAAGRFGYQMQHFTAARRALMPPFHRDDENEGFCGAMAECRLAIRRFKVDTVSADAQDSLAVIMSALDVTGLVDPPGGRHGLAIVKARQMTRQEKSDFSQAVDALATYFWFQCFAPEKNR